MTIIERPLPKPESVFADPAASSWLKEALRTFRNRDPVDAINDAEVLLQILEHQLAKL